jgi:hypothetical protein
LENKTINHKNAKLLSHNAFRLSLLAPIAGSILSEHWQRAWLKDKQYQLWAIVSGKPVSLGVLDSSNTMQEGLPVSNPQAFAITLEPSGGSINPTMDQMYAMAGLK